MDLDAAEIEKLRQSEERYRLMAEATPAAKVLVDRRGRIVFVNRQAERLFGYPRAELLDQPIEILVPARFRAGHPGSRDGFFTDPKTRNMGAGRDLYGLKKDGTEVPVEIGLNPMETREGFFVLAAIIDISERKKAEERFRLVVEAAPNAMVMVGKDGKMVLVNSQAEKLFGYERAEMLGRPIEMLVPARFRRDHPASRDAFFGAPRTRSMGSGRELFGVRKDGSEVPVEIGLNPLDTREGAFVLASIIDITERKRAEDERRKSRELEEENLRIAAANRLKSQFLANMSHELRTPLNAVIGFGEILHDEKAGPLLPAQKEYLGDILTSSRHLLQLLNDVLDLAKLESGKMSFSPEDLSLAAVVAEVRGVLSGMAEKKGVRFAVELSPAVDRVRLDPARLKQVLYNYLSNALKFTSEGGLVTIRTAPEAPGFFRLEVEDTGVGIPGADFHRLFIEFQQLEHPLTKKQGGTGLGLALTKRIVEAQGGRVGVRSEAGRGSVFHAVLPLTALAS